jgi:hypothetical protein
MRAFIRSFTLSLIVVAATVAVTAQQPQQPPATPAADPQVPRPSFETKAEIVLVDVNVVDRNAKPAADLTAGDFDSCCTPRMITSYSAVPPHAVSRSTARVRCCALVSRLVSVNMLSLNAASVTWSFGPSAARNFFTAFFNCGIDRVMLSLTSIATTISSGEPSAEKCSMVCGTLSSNSLNCCCCSPDTNRP